MAPRRVILGPKNGPPGGRDVTARGAPNGASRDPRKVPIWSTFGLDRVGPEKTKMDLEK